MKKVIIAILLILSVVPLCSCGGDKDDGGQVSSVTVPVYADGSGTVDAPDSVTIETRGSVTVSGKIEKDGDRYVIYLDSLTTFVIKSANGSTSYPDCKRLLFDNGVVTSELEGYTAVVSGTLQPVDGGAELYLTDVTVENVLD